VLSSALCADVSSKGNIGVGTPVSLAVDAKGIEFVLTDELVKVGELLLRLGLDWETCNFWLSCLHFNNSIKRSSRSNQYS